MSKDYIIMLKSWVIFVYEVCELAYTTSYLNAHLVLSTQCLIMVKDYVIMLKRGVILVNQYVVLLRGVIPESLHMRHCVNKTTRGFDIITYRLDKLLLNKMTQTLT